MKNIAELIIFSATMLLWTPHGIQNPLTMSVLRRPMVVTNDVWVTQTNAIPPYTKFFFALAYKTSSSINVISAN